MRFDRRFAAVAALALALPTLGWGNDRTHEAIERKLAMRKQLAKQHPTMLPTAQSGQVGNFAVSVGALLTAMDIDPVTVLNPSFTGGASQSAVFPGLGMLQPTLGPNFAWLSSGVAGAGTATPADPSGTDPYYGGNDAQVGAGNDPPPQFQSCGTDPTSGQTMYDCVGFSFSFVVPSGMHSISFDFDFMSTEYPEYVGPFFDYDDRFVVSIASPSHNYSNIVFDANGNPVTIDSAFFNQPCSTLIGTGFGIVDDFFGDCDAGGTGVLTTTAPVEPGETVAISFGLHDEGDSSYDSAVMIDNFVISAEVVEGPQTSGAVTIDYLSPKSGPLGGGTSTLIHGEGFENVQAVSFGGIPALFNVLDEFTLQAITPPHSEGPVDVAVTAQPGNSVSTGIRSGGFIYYVSPEGSPLNIVSVDPPQGPSSGGVAVAVRGAGFKADTIITFDGEAVESQEFINGDEIVVVTPNGSGAADVRAVNPDGTDAQLDGGYVYIGNGGDDGSGARGFTKGCSCSLDTTAGPASSAAAPIAIVGLVFAAWLARRRQWNVRKAAFGLAAAPAVLLGAGCNDSSLAPVNSAPIADAGPSTEAFIGDEITLDGTESRDFEDGTNLEFMWEIVTKPVGSIAVLDDPSEKTPSFIPDVAGLYRVGLIVRDSDDIESGPIGFGGNDDDNLTDVVALPFRDLKVTLSWDSDSDLDIHLIRPNTDLWGGYWDPDYDCFYGAPDPEWGSTGIEADNPLLALDVDTGMGPEEIALASPQDNGTYKIYVHVFNQHGAAPANATVSVSIEGSIVAEVGSASPLSTTDTVWLVGTLQWPENVFTTDNYFTTHSMLNGPPH